MDRNIIACWWGARSVILDTVFPTGLPFDIFWPHILHEFIGVPESLLPVLIGCIDANLVEDLNQVVERHQTFGFICRRIPGKETNQYTKNIPNVLNQFQYQNFMKSFFEGSSVPISLPSFDDVRRHSHETAVLPVEPALFFCISGPTSAYFRIWTAIFACEIAHSSWIFRFSLI